jgi:hypothetical protein
MHALAVMRLPSLETRYQVPQYSLPPMDMVLRHSQTEIDLGVETPIPNDAPSRTLQDESQQAGRCGKILHAALWGLRQG